MKMLLTRSALLILASVCTLGCGADEESELPDVDCDGDIPTYDEVALFGKCVTCHDSSKSGASRADAPDDVNFDTEAKARMNAEHAAEEVNEGEMPPASANITVTEAEKEALYKWALCSD